MDINSHPSVRRWSCAECSIISCIRIHRCLIILVQIIPSIRVQLQPPYLFDSHFPGCKCHDYSIHQIHRQRLLVSGDPRSETFPRILLTSDYSTRRAFCDLQPSLSHPCCREIVVSGGLIIILDHLPSVRINWHRWLRRTILGWTERRLRQAGSCLRSNCSNGHCVG